MVLQDPKVEFVPINLNEAVATDGSNTGGGQYCIASMQDAQYCPGWVNDVDWEQ